MTFPLELTEIGKEEKILDNKYLYPPEIKDIQMEIEEVCDRMEYDGSMMFDECPDKVTVERVVNEMCSRNNYGNCCAEGTENGLLPLYRLCFVMKWATGETGECAIKTGCFLNNFRNHNLYMVFRYKYGLVYL